MAGHQFACNQSLMGPGDSVYRIYSTDVMSMSCMALFIKSHARVISTRENVT